MNSFYLGIAEKCKEGFSTETDRADWGLRLPDARLNMQLPLLRNGAGRNGRKQCGE